MAKKKTKTPDQIRLETRFAIFVVYIIYNMLTMYALNKSMFISHNVIGLWWLNLTMSSSIMLYALDLKNIRGWWNKRVYNIIQKRRHRKEIEARLAKERGMGYGEIER